MIKAFKNKLGINFDKIRQCHICKSSWNLIEITEYDAEHRI